MMTSTSFHSLNADKGCSKLVWMFLNVLNNNWAPNKKNEHLSVSNFIPKLVEQDWDKTYVKSSPSRALSDLFWLKLDWAAVKSELGNINIFDTGAGRGGYALRLNEFAIGISSYFGVDVTQHPEWDNIMREFTFIKLRRICSDYLFDIIPSETNFFMSQSAIEHFDNDLLYFKQLKGFIDKTDNNTIQVHLFPSAACLKLYPQHGVRQYTPRTVSTIVELFNSPKTYSTLYKLGGKYCNDLHFRFITHPLKTKGVDWRDSKTVEYRDLLKIAVKKDIERMDDDPSFYALVIHSNYKVPVFRAMGGLTDSWR